MRIFNRQIGWSQESNLLWEIAKRLEQLIGITSNVSGPPGPPGPSVGLFAQTANSVPVSGTDVETSVVNGGVGTLTVPANAFSVGDSFKADLSGIFSAANNQTIRIRVKSGAVVLLDSGVQSLTNTISNDIFTLSLDFTIRQIGAAGVASLASFGRFTYLKTNNSSTQGFGMNTINNSTFSTTVSNTLDITVQWGSTDSENSIYTDVFISWEFQINKLGGA
jgi:hypothetical protein